MKALFVCGQAMRMFEKLHATLKILFVCGQAMCKFEPTGSCNFFTYLGSQCYLLARSSLPNNPSCIPNASSCVLPFSLTFLLIDLLSR